MLSVTTDRFRKAFDRLPSTIKDKARSVYLLWQSNPYHPSLNFKQVYSEKQIYLVRIGFSYRSLGIKQDDTFDLVFGLAHMKTIITLLIIYKVVCKKYKTTSTEN